MIIYKDSKIDHEHIHRALAVSKAQINAIQHIAFSQAEICWVKKKNILWSSTFFTDCQNSQFSESHGTKTFALRCRANLLYLVILLRRWSWKSLWISFKKVKYILFIGTWPLMKPLALFIFFIYYLPTRLAYH